MEKWHIIQTRPRWEKKVADCLDQKGFESYCPVKKVRRKWSDRVKTLEQPLFRSCVLVRIAPEQKTDVRLIDGVINFVYHNGKAAQVKEKDIQMLRKALNDGAVTNFEKEENYNGRLRTAVEVYLDNFSQWLQACMEKPKLA